MAKKTIDCYGFSKTSVDYFKRQKVPVNITTSGNYTYLRFSTEETGPIHRIENSGSSSSIMWAYGAWSDRESLTYDTDLNTPKTLTV